MEVLMLPEMLQAGVEALDEARGNGMGDDDICVAVFLAMRAIEQIAEMRLRGAMVH